MDKDTVRRSRSDCKKLIGERNLPYSIIMIGRIPRLKKEGEPYAPIISSWTKCYEMLESLPYDETIIVDELPPSVNDKGFHARFLRDEFEPEVMNWFIKFMDGRDVIEEDGEVIYHFSDVKDFCEKHAVPYPGLE